MILMAACVGWLDGCVVGVFVSSAVGADEGKDGIAVGISVGISPFTHHFCASLTNDAVGVEVGSGDDVGIGDGGAAKKELAALASLPVSLFSVAAFSSLVSSKFSGLFNFTVFIRFIKSPFPIGEESNRPTMLCQFAGFRVGAPVGFSLCSASHHHAGREGVLHSLTQLLSERLQKTFLFSCSAKYHPS
jgi:hypothetical protein